MAEVATISPATYILPEAIYTGGRIDAGAIVSRARLQGTTLATSRRCSHAISRAGQLDVAVADIEDVDGVAANYRGGIAASAVDSRGVAPGGAAIAGDAAKERAVLEVEVKAPLPAAIAGLSAAAGEAGAQLCEAHVRPPSLERLTATAP